MIIPVAGGKEESDLHRFCQCEPCRRAYAKYQTDGRSREEVEAHGFSELCQDMFGPAADPMIEYFTTLERLWVTLDNVKGPERKLFQWSQQFTADAEDLAVMRRCRTLLEQAASQAATEPQKQRIALFAKTFDVPATPYEFTAAARIPRQDVTAFWQRIEQQILPDPLTLYGAGPAHGDLRKRIQAACDTATAGGKKSSTNSDPRRAIRSSGSPPG